MDEEHIHSAVESDDIPRIRRTLQATLNYATSLKVLPAEKVKIQEVMQEALAALDRIERRLKAAGTKWLFLDPRHMGCSR